ncbi:hypothetical protein LSM04_003437 [Trypanosoma melophagium]|uniref:uncharacterized protein n=1 Tax=Trypanosoma melophagium TaxID=715481 RepID=UPI00351A5407|nr:hypothetical protein LSM04_003437 [Trypanosoma melophagium]
MSTFHGAGSFIAIAAATDCGVNSSCAQHNSFICESCGDESKSREEFEMRSDNISDPPKNPSERLVNRSFISFAKLVSQSYRSFDCAWRAKLAVFRANSALEYLKMCKTASDVLVQGTVGNAREITEEYARGVALGALVSAEAVKEAKGALEIAESQRNYVERVVRYGEVALGAAVFDNKSAGDLVAASEELTLFVDIAVQACKNAAAHAESAARNADKARRVAEEAQLKVLMQLSQNSKRTDEILETRILLNSTNVFHNKNLKGRVVIIDGSSSLNKQVQIHLFTVFFLLLASILGL